MDMNTIRTLALLALAAPLAGCSEGGAKSTTGDTGQVIAIRMVTDERGNYFEPAELTVKRGAVLRFTLASGVHSVSFQRGRTVGAVSTPAPSRLLQLPGETRDVTVDVEPGEYFFRCDPHMALGMVGRLRVE
jgi:plastocyanin